MKALPGVFKSWRDLWDSWGWWLCWLLFLVLGWKSGETGWFVAAMLVAVVMLQVHNRRQDAQVARNVCRDIWEKYRSVYKVVQTLTAYSHEIQKDRDLLIKKSCQLEGSVLDARRERDQLQASIDKARDWADQVLKEQGELETQCDDWEQLVEEMEEENDILEGRSKWLEERVEVLVNMLTGTPVDTP